MEGFEVEKEQEDVEGDEEDTVVQNSQESGRRYY